MSAELSAILYVMNSLNKKKQHSWQLFDQIANSYDGINRILSFGIDGLWRRHFPKYLPDRNDLQCLDIATGTADVALVLAADERVRNVQATDLSKKMLAIAKQKVAKSPYKHKITISEGDGVQIPSNDASFDVVTVAFGVRNFGNYHTSLKNMHRVLKSDGRALILEFSLPTNPVIRAGYLLYFRHLLPRIGNLLSRHRNAYTYLNKTVEDFPSGTAFGKSIMAAGFNRVEYKKLTFGIATLYTAHKERDG